MNGMGSFHCCSRASELYIPLLAHCRDILIRIVVLLVDVPGFHVNASIGDESLLTCAAGYGELDIVEKLLGFRELDLSNSDVNRMALIVALQFSRAEVAERLMRCDGFDINYVSDSGQAASAYAVMNSLTGIVAQFKSSPRFDP
jgi:hypothetical protein